MAKDGGPDRPADKADEIGSERCKGCSERILVGEVKFAEYQTGSRAVEEKVVPFDGCADVEAMMALRRFELCSVADSVP
jgi:hypothetical protein